MKHETKKFLERTGLLKLVFRAYEVIQSNRRASTTVRDRNNLGPDGLPIPPGKLIVLVGGHNDASAFLEGGKTIAKSIQDVLQSHSLCMERFSAVLDFGCGCGRIIRYWKTLPATRVYGTDYNSELIRWCSTNLPFANFRVNAFLPPFDYPAHCFDFAYAFSVFTHLTEAAQFAWMRELARVIKPGGYLLITTHGERYIGTLTPMEQIKFKAGELVVRYETVAGTNLCAAFHPVPFIRKLSGAGFDIVEVIPQKAEQDFVLMQRTSASP